MSSDPEPLSDEDLAVVCATEDALIREFRALVEKIKSPEAKAELQKLVEADLEHQRRNPPPR